MRVDENGRHDEHVKMLEALSSNLKSEVARGLRLLDSCVTNIAQARWILSNVDESLSGFSKGCPVCGTLPERNEKQGVKAAGKEIKQKSVIVVDDSPPPKEPERPVVKPKPKPGPASMRKKSRSPSPARSKAPPPTAPPPPAHRVGPRSKTVVASEPVQKVLIARSSVSDETIKSTPKSEAPSTLFASKLPKKCSLVIAQTIVTIKLTDVKPYLRGKVTKVDLNNLNGFVSPTQTIPADLKFKPQLVKVKTQPQPVKKSAPGPASRKFFESLKPVPIKPVSSKPKLIDLDSDSSDHEKEKPKPVVKVPPPRPASVAPPPKRKDSDSGSDYDFNFAKTTTTNSSSKKSKIGSQVTLLSKRPRPATTDSDEDYSYKKKKGSQSIFKKKVSESSNSDSDSDSDRYERKKKKKVKRKDSTDKERERGDKSKHESTAGSKASSVVSSRMTITLNSSKHGSGKCDSHKSRSESRRDSGSTTGSLVKSDIGKVPEKSDFGKDVKSKSEPGDTTAKVSTDSSSAAVPVKPGYRPGPASRKIKVVQAAVPVPTNNVSETKLVTTSTTETSEQRTENDTVKPEKVKRDSISTNGVQDAVDVKTPPTSKVDPFTLLKQQIKATAASGTNDAKSASAPASGGGISNLMSTLDADAKQKLLARLTLISLQKSKLPAVPKPSTDGSSLSPAQASLKALTALVKSPKPSTVESVPAPAPPPEVEEEKSIELGDDIIGKCIDHIEGDNDNDTVPVVVGSAESEPSPRSFTFEDCLSPDENGAEGDGSQGSNSQPMTTVEQIQKLLLKLSSEPLEEAALLHSQDKINELFAAGLHPSSAELETYRGDLQEGLWYVVKEKSLGKAVCADTISLYEWEKKAEDELSRILTELKEYTSSCVR